MSYFTITIFFTDYYYALSYNTTINKSVEYSMIIL